MKLRDEGTNALASPQTQGGLHMLNLSNTTAFRWRSILTAGLVAVTFGALAMAAPHHALAAKAPCGGDTFESAKGVGPLTNRLVAGWTWCSNGKKITRVTNVRCTATPAAGWTVKSKSCKATRRSDGGYLLNNSATFEFKVCFFKVGCASKSDTIRQQVSLAPNGSYQLNGG